MSLDEAIKQMTDTIKAVRASAEVKTAKMSDEEAGFRCMRPRATCNESKTRRR